MGTRTAGLTALLVAWACGCGGSDPQTPATIDPALHLVAEPESVGIQPSQSKDIRFRLLDPQDQPVPGRVLQFSIVDDPLTGGDDAAGATLSFGSGVTNDQGEVSLQVIAGPTMTRFRVRASALRAGAIEVIVLVTSATLAPVELAPVLVEAQRAGQEVTTVRLYVLDAGACATVRFDALPGPMRSIPVDTIALFSTVSTAAHHPIVAVGLDAAGVARAGGCVDLPGGLLLVDVALRVQVPMHHFRVAPEGSYDVSSRLTLGAGLKSTATVTQAWNELAACSLDPARLWLDCTLDALASNDTDPLDCQPADDEGPLGAKLLARRGVPLSTAGGDCPDVKDASGKTSLDVLAGNLFAAPRARIVDGLPQLGGEVARLLGVLDLRSTITITATSSPGQYTVDHVLGSASFPQAAAPVMIPLVSLGAPVLEASFVPAMRKDDGLALGTHAFTLRLGTTAQLAFARASLIPRGAPADPGAFVTALFSTATHDDQGTTLTGCAALDALVCPEVGEARGCLLTACAAGLIALQHNLDAGFLALDGEDVDFVLDGSVPVVDTDGDGAADALGRPEVTPGRWSGEVRGRGGPEPVNGTWTATRVR